MGSVVLIIGIISGIAGIAFSISQNDIKKMLAYSSIENIGIICIALGLALLGRHQGRNDWILLGFGGVLLHSVNHGLFKSLLFFNAGTVIHAMHTRDINQMGGLAKKMPLTMILFVIGAVAICALPPMNGFMSEWLIYIGLFKTITGDAAQSLPFAALGAVALATIGALAVAAFVKLAGAVYLGNPRNESINHAEESPVLLIPMCICAVLCIFVGVYPLPVMNILGGATHLWARSTESAGYVLHFAPLQLISIIAAVVLSAIIFFLLVFRLWPRGKDITAGTWDCGYAKPTNKMQYTGSSTGDTLVKLFGFILWPVSQKPEINGAFPCRFSFKSVVNDTILDRIILPFFRFAAHYLPMVRVFQMGQTHTYVLYILSIFIVLLIVGF